MTGSGTSDSPYIITTIQDLVDITDVPYDMSAYYQLGADIDLTGDETFKGIASYDTPFEGHFDGKKHTISHWNGSIVGDAAGFSGLRREQLSRIYVWKHVRCKCGAAGGIITKTKTFNSIFDDISGAEVARFYW